MPATTKLSRNILLTAILLGSILARPALAAIDWSSVPGKDVVLFYPGQSSWEFVMSAADHDGAIKFREGKSCRQCHEDELKPKGDLLVSGKKNEPSPIPGKPGYVEAKVKIAHDDTNMYVHLEFNDGSQPDAKMDKSYATKVTMMLNDGKAPEGNRAGCWAVCHDDSTGMASANGASRTKYLGKTRNKLSRQGGGDDLKSADDLAKLKADSYFLEYWTAKLNPNAPPVFANGTVFDKREDTAKAVTGDAAFANGSWSVTMVRKLNAGDGFKDFTPDKTYTIGFAIHSGHTAGRFHYVSLEHTLILDKGVADFVAEKK